jgi:hypothetical protein
MFFKHMFACQIISILEPKLATHKHSDSSLIFEGEAGAFLSKVIMFFQCLFAWQITSTLEPKLTTHKHLGPSTIFECNAGTYTGKEIMFYNICLLNKLPSYWNQNIL